MSKKPSGRTTRRSKRAPASGRSTPRPRPKAPLPPPTPDEDAFTRSLIAHGQAARARPDGTLPPGATHELVEDDHGRLRAVRRRFSVI
jgi:hypothetical protein